MDATEEILARVSKLSPQARLSYLARLAHGITIAMRDAYEAGGTGLTNPSEARKLNEIQHQVTGALADFLASGGSTYTAESLTERVLASREDIEIGRLLDFFVNAAVDQAECSQRGG